jgi:hypothetical protein
MQLNLEPREGFKIVNFGLGALAIPLGTGAISTVFASKTSIDPGYVKGGMTVISFAVHLSRPSSLTAGWALAELFYLVKDLHDAGTLESWLDAIIPSMRGRVKMTRAQWDALPVEQKQALQAKGEVEISGITGRRFGQEAGGVMGRKFGQEAGGTMGRKFGQEAGNVGGDEASVLNELRAKVEMGETSSSETHVVVSR